MEVILNKSVCKSANHPLLKFVDTFDQWKEEQFMLRRKLHRLNNVIKRTSSNFEYFAWKRPLCNVEKKFIDFMIELDKYLNKKEEAIYPIFGKNTTEAAQHIQILKRKLVVANQFSQFFIEKIDRFIADNDREGAEEAVNCMLQALDIISDHLRVEEELILPILEQIMTDVDYITL